MLLNRTILLLNTTARHSFQPNKVFYIRNVKYSKTNPLKSFQTGNSQGLVEQKLSQHSEQPLKMSNLVKPFLFTIGFGTASYVGATIWEYENARARAIRALKSPFNGLRDSFKKRRQEMVADLKQKWQHLPAGERFFIPICALNLIVFGLWRVPGLQSHMFKYFCSNPVGKAVCWPMLLSTFSHYSVFHIFANMYVLHSFSNGICASLGKEQMVGFYLAAGVIASFASYAHKTVTRVGGFSLGASGAIMAILGYVCTKYPDSQLGIIFVPFFTFSAGTAIKVIMGIDFAGIVMGWKFFDHAAHLGGALFGVFWYKVGVDQLWPKRGVILEKWHNWRTSSG